VSDFHKDEIAVFDRFGAPIGVLTGWSVEQPRSFRLNEIEDFAFSIPRQDITTGETIITNAVAALLKADNLILINDQLGSMRNWVGYIDNVAWSDGRVSVSVIGSAGLLRQVDASLIQQSEGWIWSIASRLVGAANAKKSVHSDIPIGFVVDGAEATWRRNYGMFTYEGDVFAGLQGLASESLCEFFMESALRSDGWLTITLRWGSRYVADRTDIVISDIGGALSPGTEVTIAASNVVNRARIRGTATELAQYVDYQSVKSVINDVVPEAELVLDGPADQYRRREDLNITANFGYSEAIQKDLARQVQERYIGYYKSFLYAYHARLGKPYLDGYDWPGPDGTNDKGLTAHFYRSYSRLAVLKTGMLLLSPVNEDEVAIEATLEDWAFNRTLNIVDKCVGVATNWTDTETKLVADSTTGSIWTLDDDLVTVTELLHVAATGETLQSVATDVAQATLMWVLVTNATEAIVRAYTVDSGRMVSQWTFPDPYAHDISAQSDIGVVWLASSGSPLLRALDMSSGVELTTGTYRSFATGLTPGPTGVCVTGGIAYCIDANGLLRMLHIDPAGNLAGTKAVGVPATGIFADAPGGRIWITKANGDINLYWAHIAIGSVADGSSRNWPGFGRIMEGQYLHVVLNSDTAKDTKRRNKVVAVYSPGRYVTHPEPSPIGEADVLTKEWVTGDQKVVTLVKSKIQWANNEAVVSGEESRMDQWSPTDDGYGYFASAIYKTKRGHLLSRGRSWYFRDWDVPASTFAIDAPEWTDGLAYLQKYLAQVNKERAVQVLRVLNVSGLWGKIALGGKYTVRITKQGPPGGFNGILRVLAFTPDERQGIMEIIGEWVGEIAPLDPDS